MLTRRVAAGLMVAIVVGVAVLGFRARADDRGRPLSPPQTMSARSAGDHLDGADSDSADRTTAPPARARTAPQLARRTRLRRAARRAVERGRAHGGRVRVAIIGSGWDAPILAGDDVGRTSRMWSLSKPVVAVAALEAAEASPRGRPSAALRTAVTDALQQSNNCAIRRVVLGLEALTGGRAGGRRRFRSVLDRAGITFSGAPQAGGEITAFCRRYLAEHPGAGDPYRRSALYGVHRWTIEAAARFGLALASGVYGRPGRLVLHDLALPKLASAEVPPGQFTADPAWGAGKAFGDRAIAYKAGWGGYNKPDGYTACQLIMLGRQDSATAVAVAFAPQVRPTNDDPGQTSSPAAIEDALAPIAAALRRDP